MIGYLNGKLISYKDGTVILETGGVGFEVACSSAVYDALIKNGGGEVFIYTAVREDAISLYGFISPDEKDIFLQLISVSGVGPKMGITILSQTDTESLKFAIATSDIKALSAVKGLGKKTAERIIVELREKIGEVGVPSAKPKLSTDDFERENEDAIAALMSLGFSKTESVNAVKKAIEQGATTVQSVISAALKIIK